MPPPLLSRHLRPCHHPWSARHVRHARQYARRPAVPSEQHHDEAPKRKESWWSSAVASITSLGLRTARAEPDAQPKAPPSPDATEPPAPRTPTAPHVAQPTARRETEPVQDGDRESIQRQLQQLFEQVQVLQKRLAEKTPESAAATPPALRTTTPVTSASPRGKASTQTKPSARHVVLEASRSQLVLEDAHRCYRTSVNALVTVANELDASLPSVAEPIALKIRQHLTVLARVAQADQDRTTLRILGKYRMAPLEGLVHEALPLQQSAEYAYRKSVYALIKTERALQRMSSPAVAPLVIKTRNILLAMLDQARADNDVALRKALRKLGNNGGRYNRIVPNELMAAENDLLKPQAARSTPPSFTTARAAGPSPTSASRYAKENSDVEDIKKHASSTNVQSKGTAGSTSSSALTIRPKKQHTSRNGPGARLLDRAWACYRDSTITLIDIGDEIHHNMPARGAPVLAAILEVAVFILRDAKLTGRKNVINTFAKYNSSFVARQANLRTLHSAGLYKQYRRSAKFLAEIARDLESIPSTSVSRLAIKVRHRLQVMEEEAEATNDRLMLSALKTIKDCDSALAQKDDGALNLSRHDRAEASPSPSSLTSGSATVPPLVNRFEKLASNEQPTDSANRTTILTGASEQPVPITKYEPNARMHAKHDGSSGTRRLDLGQREVTTGDDVESTEAGFEAPRSIVGNVHMRRVKLEQRNAESEDDNVSPSEPERSTSSYAQSPHEGHEDQNGQTLERKIRTQARVNKSSDHRKSHPSPNTADVKTHSPSPSTRPAQIQGEPSRQTDTNRLELTQSQSNEINEQSLLDELFPEVTTLVSPPAMEQDAYKHSKLELPASEKVLVRRVVDERPRTLKEQVVESFQKSGEQTTVLQLEHCSTELTEVDFRRLIPKGKHIGEWNRHGEFYKVIPGRDPLSLERLPFYYLLFKTPESATAYQKNVSRLHKLTALHQPSSIFSAVPVPTGFIEDGEDISAITKSYLLKPTEHPLSLHMLMQPYHPALRKLIERGGYNPIMPDVDDKGNRIYKVLLHIEGWEPSHSDLYRTMRRDAYLRGTSLNLRNELSTSIHRLRDIINLKTRSLPISTTNPRAYGHFEPSDQTLTERVKAKLEFEDPNVSAWMKGDDADENAQEVNQMVMNRVYNRWLIEFDDEDEARRFAVQWHRRVLPERVKTDRTWKDYEEVRMCNCEFLW